MPHLHLDYTRSAVTILVAALYTVLIEVALTRAHTQINVQWYVCMFPSLIPIPSKYWWYTSGLAASISMHPELMLERSGLMRGGATALASWFIVGYGKRGCYWVAQAIVAFRPAAWPLPMGRAARQRGDARPLPGSGLSCEHACVFQLLF